MVMSITPGFANLLMYNPLLIPPFRFWISKSFCWIRFISLINFTGFNASYSLSNYSLAFLTWPVIILAELLYYLVLFNHGWGQSVGLTFTVIWINSNLWSMWDFYGPNNGQKIFFSLQVHFSLFLSILTAFSRYL